MHVPGGRRESAAMEALRGYPVRTRRVRAAGMEFLLLGPANYEELVDDPRVVRRFERDEYLPYWAEFWPACTLLVEALSALGARRSATSNRRAPSAAAPGAPPCGSPGAFRGPLLLELGCGLGLVSLAALRLGYRVIASDYDEDALAFVQESARRNGLPPPETRLIDWRETYDDVRPDVIVAAEVLYETRSLRPVAEFVAGHLAPAGVALISDANRSTADDFPMVARHCGLDVRTETVEATPAADPLWESATGPGPRTVRGRVFHLRRRPA